MNRAQQVVPAPTIIVVVDDDPAVRNSLKFSLELEGYSVRLFSGPDEVLRDELPTHGCLVIDHVMPHMSGLDLLAALRDRQVSLPAILITTRPSIGLRERATKMHTTIVEKPLLGDGLVQAIRQALANPV